MLYDISHVNLCSEQLHLQQNPAGRHLLTLGNG